MLNLTSTSDLVQVVTDATADIEAHASWAELTIATGAILPGRTNTASITTATTTTVVAAPASGVIRNVKFLSLTNNHASTATNVSVVHTDGTNPTELRAVNLLAGENLTLDNNGNWRHYDANGGEYAAIGPMATQAEMEAGTSLVTVVTPGRQHFHPSSVKAWGKAVGAGTSLTVNYNITSVADTGTGRLGVTIATDFSSVNYSITANVERSVTSLAVAGVEGYAIRNASVTATAFEIESYDHTATTMVAQDPANYFWQCCGDQA